MVGRGRRFAASKRAMGDLSLDRGQYRGAGKLKLLLDRQLAMRSAQLVVRVLQQVLDRHFSKAPCGAGVEAPFPTRQDHEQGVDWMRRGENCDGFHVESIFEEPPDALRRCVEIVVRIAMQRLKKGDRAEQFAAWLEDARDLLRAKIGRA